jgi:hypothetical protein
MKLILYLPIITTALFGYSQQTPHPSIWPMEYSIQYHITDNFINRYLDRGHSQVWNEDLQRFHSSIYENLSYPEGAGNSYIFEMASLEYGLNSFFQSDFRDFSPDQFENYFKKGKKLVKGYLTYDSVGRITKMARKASPNLNSKQEETVEFVYTPRTINIKLKKTSFYYFGNYQSSIAGNIRYRPLRLKTDWELSQYMSDIGCTDSVISNFSSYANGRKDFDPNNSKSKYSFHWDSIGRLTHERVVMSTDSVYLDRRYNYVDRRIDRDALSDNWIMKSPPIRRWFDSIKEPIYLSKNQGEGSLGFLRSETFKVFSYLSSSSRSPFRLIDRFHDSISEYKAIYTVYRIDSLDTIPYRPTKLVDTDLLVQPADEIIQRPPGMIDASAEVFRRSEIYLDNGWTIIRYQRGSSGSTRVALGFKPWILLDLIYDRFVFVNNEGQAKYVYLYKKLYKITRVN